MGTLCFMGAKPNFFYMRMRARVCVGLGLRFYRGTIEIVVLKIIS